MLMNSMKKRMMTVNCIILSLLRLFAHFLTSIQLFGRRTDDENGDASLADVYNDDLEDDEDNSDYVEEAEGDDGDEDDSDLGEEEEDDAGTEPTTQPAAEGSFANDYIFLCFCCKY